MEGKNPNNNITPILSYLIYVVGIILLLCIFFDLYFYGIYRPNSSISQYVVYSESTFWRLKSSELSGYEIFVLPQPITVLIGAVSVPIFAIITKLLDDPRKIKVKPSQVTLDLINNLNQNLFTYSYYFIFSLNVILYQIRQFRYMSGDEPITFNGVMMFFYICSVGIFHLIRRDINSKDKIVSSLLLTFIYFIITIALMDLLTAGD